MSGIDYRIPLPEARKAHKLHMDGWSLRAIARISFEEWGYKSPQSALEGLRGALRTLGLPTRSQRKATADAMLVHGNSTDALRDPAHPEHVRHLAHRRQTRRSRVA